jgi:glycosyltransferase involved in cell wall biosynthesis
VTDLRCLVVIPALDESDTVARVVGDVRAAGFDCVVVDDGSTDGTGALARSAGAVVLRFPFNLGVGAALRCGFRYAIDHGYDAVVQCDADGQHPPEEIRDLIDAAVRDDAHLVIGSRFVEGGSGAVVAGGRRTVMRVLSWLVRVAGGVRVRDTSSGFRCIRRPLLDEFARAYPAQYLGDTVEALVAAGRAGYRVVEVPAPLRERAGGAPSANPRRAALLTCRVMLTVAFGIGVRLNRAPAGPDPDAHRPPAG